MENREKSAYCRGNYVITMGTRKVEFGRVDYVCVGVKKSLKNARIVEG